MLSKPKFLKFITELQSLESDIEDVHKSLQKLDPDFGGFYLSRVNTLIVQLLQESMNDKEEWISYWIYELEFGSKWRKGTITDKNKKDIKLQTAEDLYSYLIKENKNGD